MCMYVVCVYHLSYQLFCDCNTPVSAHKKMQHGTLSMYHGTLPMYHGTSAVYHGTFSYGNV